MNILNTLTIKHLKMNKRRTIVTILGIILSTSLMVGIGALVSSFRDVMLRQTIASDGNYHVLLNNFAYQDYKYIEQNASVLSSSLAVPIGFSYLENGKNEYKPYLFFEGVSKSYFKQINLMEGRIPENEKEIIISKHIEADGGVSYKVGDTLTVDLGSREGSYFKTDDLKLVNNLRLQEDEELKIKETKTYKIVGIMERSVYESHYAPGYTVLSTIPQDINNDNLASSFITYKKVKDVKKKTVNIVSNLKNANNNKVEADYHNSLLTFYGESSYDNINASLGMVIGVMLTVLMVGCAIVIYNSFAISVMERKKQFGLLASIGSTKKQTKHMVFFEAFIVSIIGIPLGVLAGILGIYFVLLITDKLIPLLFSVPLHLSLYPTFVIIPIIYMLLTIILSAYLPSRRASKVTPIEAIRQSNDIKISKREVRTFGFTKYLFGSEAYIASKNMKRNRKKYRITILSLIVSIVLFISASTLVKLGNQSISGILNTINFDIFITGGDDNPQLLKQLTQVDGVTYAFITNNYNFNLDLKTPNLTSNYVDKFHRQEEAEISFVSINDEEFNNLLKLNNINDNAFSKDKMNLLAFNTFKISESNYKVKEKAILLKNTDLKLNKMDAENSDLQTESGSLDVHAIIINKLPSILENTNSNDFILFAKESDMNKYLKTIDRDYYRNMNALTFVKAKDHAGVTKEMKKIVGNKEFNIYDYTDAMQTQKNLMIVMEIFLFGFVTLVSLIGVTSVFNTINTSISLRRKEFAVLRSIGLSPKGFNKMLCFESILCGFKALVFGIPLSLCIVFFLAESFNGIYEGKSFIPWNAYLIVVILVFVVIFATLEYATHKMKKENIMNAIREENI